VFQLKEGHNWGVFSDQERKQNNVAYHKGCEILLHYFPFIRNDMQR
jgi:hypothetical protein